MAQTNQVHSEGYDEKKQDSNQSIIINSCNMPFSQSFDTEMNILTKNNMNVFKFSGYPNTNTSGSQAKSIADEINRTTNSEWKKYGYQTGQNDDGIAYIQIDLNIPYYITKYAVSGYPLGLHRPTSVYYLRASNDAKTWTNVGISDVKTWTNDKKATYPFRHIQQVTDPGFYRYYQFYGVGYDNKYLLIMNAGLWTPQKMSYNKWKLSQRILDIDDKKSNPMSQWNTKHVVYWIGNMVNWGNKTDEKHKCMKELRDWEVGGNDLINADKHTLNSLNIKNPLIQQRILDCRDTVLRNPQIVTEIMNNCNESNIKFEQIENELQLIKKQIMRQNGVLSLANSWSHYEGEFKQAKWFKIGNIVIVHGLIKSNNFASQTHMATLPKSCCPKQRIIFSLDQHSASFRVDVCEDGKLLWVKGSNTYNWISLGGIVFTVD